MSKEMEVTEWTSFAGNFHPERCLMFTPITRLYTPAHIFPFHGKLGENQMCNKS